MHPPCPSDESVEPAATLGTLAGGGVGGAASAAKLGLSIPSVAGMSSTLGGSGVGLLTGGLTRLGLFALDHNSGLCDRPDDRPDDGTGS